MNRYRHPFPGAFGRILGSLANSVGLANLRHAVMRRLPFLKLESDVTDVVYLTWMVDVDAAQALAPAGHVLWQRDGKTPFTILTYRHGHFGPAVLGGLRRMMPSPLQSNWRLYSERPGQVIFLKNVLSNPLHAMGTRIFSDALQSHYPASFRHAAAGNVFKTEIVPGDGSAPALQSAVRIAATKTAPPQFTDWHSAVEFLACQDIAIAHVARNDALAVSKIELPIQLSEVQPLEPIGEVTCPLLRQLNANCQPFCFLVPAVKFRVLSERLELAH